jgi:hypothetical protein
MIVLKIAERLGLSRGIEVEGPICTLQRALAEIAATDKNEAIDALDATVRQSLWGSRHQCFADFVLGVRPAGLEVRSLEELEYLRELLLHARYYAEWVELMERTMRQQGRPRKNLTNGEVFPRFYSLDRSPNAQDRMLLNLKNKHPDEFANLCKSKGAIRQAAIKAGVIVVANKKALRFGVCDVTAASRLSETTKARLLRELFLALGVNAQCTFLKGLEAGLGPDIARRWRAHMTQPTDVMPNL